MDQIWEKILTTFIFFLCLADEISRRIVQTNPDLTEISVNRVKVLFDAASAQRDRNNCFLVPDDYTISAVVDGASGKLFAECSRGKGMKRKRGDDLEAQPPAAGPQASGSKAKKKAQRAQQNDQGLQTVSPKRKKPKPSAKTPARPAASAPQNSNKKTTRGKTKTTPAAALAKDLSAVPTTSKKLNKKEKKRRQAAEAAAGPAAAVIATTQDAEDKPPGAVVGVADGAATPELTPKPAPPPAVLPNGDIAPGASAPAGTTPGSGMKKSKKAKNNERRKKRRQQKQGGGSGGSSGSDGDTADGTTDKEEERKTKNKKQEGGGKGVAADKDRGDGVAVIGTQAASHEPKSSSETDNEEAPEVQKGAKRRKVVASSSEGDSDGAAHRVNKDNADGKSPRGGQPVPDSSTDGGEDEDKTAGIVSETTNSDEIEATPEDTEVEESQGKGKERNAAVSGEKGATTTEEMNSSEEEDEVELEVEQPKKKGKEVKTAIAVASQAQAAKKKEEEKKDESSESGSEEDSSDSDSSDSESESDESSEEESEQMKVPIPKKKKRVSTPTTAAKIASSDSEEESESGSESGSDSESDSGSDTDSEATQSESEDTKAAKKKGTAAPAVASPHSKLVPSKRFEGQGNVLRQLLNKASQGGAVNLDAVRAEAEADHAKETAAAAANINYQWQKGHENYRADALVKLCRMMVRDAINAERKDQGLPELTAAKIYKDGMPDWWPLADFAAGAFEKKDNAIKVYNAARDVLAAIHGVQLEKKREEAKVENAEKKKKK